MRKITANYIYSPECGFLKYGIVVLNEDDSIKEIISTKGTIKEVQGLEFYSGLIVVGRIKSTEILEYLEQEDSMLEVLLNKLLKDKPPEGLSILNNVDFTDFKIKHSTSVKILV